MRTALSLQRHILALVEKYGLDMQQTGAYLSLEQYTKQLIIENIGASRISIVCSFGGGLADVEIVLWTDYVNEDDPSDTWVPIGIKRGGEWDGFAVIDPNGDVEEFYNSSGQAILDDYAEGELLACLFAQNWFDAQLVTMKRPDYTEEELLARGYVLVYKFDAYSEMPDNDLPF